MKKNVLAMSIAALIGGLSLAGGASAAVFTNGADATDLQINKDGKGHILLVPYYNASENNTTVINLVNSDTTNGKALKVRFRGANNSDDVFDFTLFLSPGDVWSGAVVHNAGSAALFTNDNSCVLPDNAGINSGTPINFVTSRLGNAGAKGTLEGYVEVLNMADIPPVSNVTGGLYKAIKHVNGVAPCFGPSEFAPIVTTLGKVDATLAEVSTGADIDAGNLRLANPTSGLFANWTIINTTNVSSWGGDATAVVATGGTGKGNIVFFPQINDVVNDVIPEVTADPLMQGATPKVTPRQYDLPDLSTPYVSASGTSAALQADTLTGALAVTAVQNEFITSSSVAGATDWVFSMPTRRYHVALDYAATGASPAYRVFREAPQSVSTYFTPANTSVDGSAARTERAGERSICVSLGSNSLDYRDRSERTPAPGGFVISPNQPAAGLSFCGEASVLSFNSATSNVLGATIGQNGVTLTSGFNSGWASINTSNVNGGTALGFPILGAAFQKYLNVGAGGVQGNFGSVWSHRYNRP
jgi:hypothetical protein